MTLREALPHGAVNDILAGTSKRDRRVASLLDTEVVRVVDGCEPGQGWPGPEVNVFVWYELETGHAVGLNENPARGWSYPIRRLPEKT